MSKTRDVRKNLEKLEKKLDVSIKILGKRVEISGEAMQEFVALQVFEAISFGFTVHKALRLSEEDTQFKIIHIKSHTKRNLKDIRARLIGTQGKTRKTLSEISGCDIIITEGEVGIIGDVEKVDDVSRAIIHMIEGAKQSNMYKFLERMNRVKKDDLIDVDY